MDQNTFQNVADAILENLFEALDDTIGDVIEVDFDNDVLTLDLNDGRQYVINKHAPNQEIWVSSPVSGAAHFAFNADTNSWISTRSDAPLIQVLETELSQVTGKSVALSPCSSGS